jgi:cytochrome c oxidase subunit 2
MNSSNRARRVAAFALTAVVVFALAACATEYPNTTFSRNTEFNRQIDDLWDLMLLLGTIVFILVEAILIYAIWRYRHREGAPEPKHVHGNTTLEIAWTLIPAIILVVIAIPTVRTIFRTQAKAIPSALQVEVIGHQWWWEFRYPQYGIVTANDLYLPVGKTVNFSLKSADVLHSFWVPQMGGKRDVISNHTNYIWFTPDSVAGSNAWNGFCVEYCGDSHANMRFRAFTVSPSDFESWVAHQRGPAAYGTVATPAAGVPATASPSPSVASLPSTKGQEAPQPPPAALPTPGAGTLARDSATHAGHGAAATPVITAGYTFPNDKLPAHVVPTTPVPAGLDLAPGIVGDPARGMKTYSSSACIGCHTIAGNPMSIGVTGPNLTHIATRSTIGAGLYPNDAAHMARWLKNARLMKPGNLMPPLGKDQIDPATGKKALTGVLTDQQIADIVAYLMALK